MSTMTNNINNNSIKPDEFIVTDKDGKQHVINIIYNENDNQNPFFNNKSYTIENISNNEFDNKFSNKKILRIMWNPKLTELEKIQICGHVKGIENIPKGKTFQRDGWDIPTKIFAIHCTEEQKICIDSNGNKCNYVDIDENTMKKVLLFPPELGIEQNRNENETKKMYFKFKTNTDTQEMFLSKENGSGKWRTWFTKQDGTKPKKKYFIGMDFKTDIKKIKIDLFDERLRVNNRDNRDKNSVNSMVNDFRTKLNLELSD